MPSYTVVSVGEQEPWSNQHGQFIGYTIQVRDEAGNLQTVKQNKKTDSPPPTEGQVLDANITPNKNPNFPPLLRVNSTNSSGGGGGGSWSRPPEDTRAMSRAHAQEMALAYMQVKATLGVGKDFRPSDLIPLIEWFQGDVNTYAAGDQPKTVGGLPVRNEPQPTATPEPTTPSAEYTPPPAPAEDIPF